MAKQGMKRPEIKKGPANSAAENVPEIQGRAKHGKEKARPIIPGTGGAYTKVFHTTPSVSHGTSSIFDSDLATDNLTNDIPWADLENE